MKLKNLKRFNPITKTESDGKLYLVGYERKPGSRKAGQQPVYLKKPVRCEIVNGKVCLVDKEQNTEEGLFYCANCGWRDYAHFRGRAQHAHDVAADKGAFVCAHIIKPVMEGDELGPVRTSADLPALRENESNVRPEAAYFTMFERPGIFPKETSKKMVDALKGAGWTRDAKSYQDADTGENVVVWLHPLRPDAPYELKEAFDVLKTAQKVEEEVTFIKARGWSMNEKFEWIHPRSGKPHAFARAVAIERTVESIPHNSGSFHGFITNHVYDDCCIAGQCARPETCPHGKAYA